MSKKPQTTEEMVEVLRRAADLVEDLRRFYDAGRTFTFKGTGGHFSACASYGIEHDDQITHWTVQPVPHRADCNDELAYRMSRGRNRAPCTCDQASRMDRKFTKEEAIAEAQRLAAGGPF